MAVDAYNAASLTTSKLVSPMMVRTYKFLQTDASTATALTRIQIVASDHGGNTATLPTTNNVTLTAPTDVAGGLIDYDAGAIAGDATAKAADRKVFTAFAASARESGGTVTLKATASGRHFKAPTPAVLGDNPATTDVVETDFEITAAVPGEQGLRDNPLSRVDFYATVDTEDGGNGRDALKYIGSVSGPGAEDYDADIDGDAATTDPDSRRYIYSLEMSKADFLAIVGGKDDYGTADDGETAATDDSSTDTVGPTEGAIFAFGVQDEKTGVAFRPAGVDLYVKK